ncbi:MAG: DsbA family protein [Rhodobacteraceae bacterium]|nr:DsbA family protein [Paracoccaceae bacterium]
MARTYIIAGAVALAAFAGAYWVMQRPAETAPTLSVAAEAQEATAVADAALVPDMMLGQADAPVEVIEYASFTCPHCQHFHETVFGQLKTNYIETGKVRFVYREVYFDKFGLWAAAVARCGGPAKYFPISDIIYDTQREWIGEGNADEISENLKKIGIKAGMTADQVDACMKDETQLKAMVETYQANATKDEINATPSFVINGQKYSNMPYEDFAKILDEKLGN